MNYNYIIDLFPTHWPAAETFSTIPQNPIYLLAWHSFLLDAGFILVALLWGAGLCGILIRQEKDIKSSLHLSAFVFVSIGVGFSLIIAELFLLVMLRTLTSVMVIALFIITSAVACYLVAYSSKNIQSILFPIKKIEALTFTIIVLALAVYQFSSLGGWSISDASKYHVPYAEFFLLNKGLASIPEYLVYPYNTLNLNLLFGLGLLIKRDFAYIQTIHATFATLTLFGIYVFCVSSPAYLRRSIALLMMYIFANIYSVHFNRFSAYVDLGAMFFVLCSVFSLYLWMNFKFRWLLVASAITFGISIGTKYLICIFALPIAIAILMTERHNWRPLLLYATWAAIWGLWWYLRNMFYTGNPVHPFASNIFGLYLWDENDMQSQMASLLYENIPKNTVGFLLMPYYAFKSDFLRIQGAFLTLSILYASTTLSWLLRGSIQYLLLASWIYIVMWFLGAQDSRYLTPIMPIVIIYFSVILNKLFSLVFKQRLGRWLSGLIAAYALVVTLFFLQQQFVRMYYLWGMNPPELYDTYMRQNNLEYDLISHANEIFDSRSTVYDFLATDARWFFKGTLAGSQFGPHNWVRMIASSSTAQGSFSPEKLEHNLKSKYAADGFLISNPPYIFFDVTEFNYYFDLQYRNSLGSIYKFRDNH